MLVRDYVEELASRGIDMNALYIYYTCNMGGESQTVKVYDILKWPDESMYQFQSECSFTLDELPSVTILDNKDIVFDHLLLGSFDIYPMQKIPYFDRLANSIGHVYCDSMNVYEMDDLIVIVHERYEFSDYGFYYDNQTHILYLPLAIKAHRIVANDKAQQFMVSCVIDERNKYVLYARMEEGVWIFSKRDDFNCPWLDTIKAPEHLCDNPVSRHFSGIVYVHDWTPCYEGNRVFIQQPDSDAIFIKSNNKEHTWCSMCVADFNKLANKEAQNGDSSLLEEYHLFRNIYMID